MGAYLFLPDSDKHEALYAIVDRNQGVRFVSLQGYIQSTIRIPIEQARRFGGFIRLRAFVDLLTFMPDRRSRFQAILQDVNGMKHNDELGIFSPCVPGKLYRYRRFSNQRNKRKERNETTR